jgi:predicted flap endonuclease-1-like 5' DNA nuclease
VTRSPADGDPADSLPRIGAPATRALAAVGVTRLSEVASWPAADLLALHGVGPRAIRLLREALASRGMSLAGEGA